MAELDRKITVCSLETLFHSVLKNKVATIKNVLEKNSKLLDDKYPHPYNKSILFIACSEDGVNAETVKTLIEKNPDILDKIENDTTPLIIASSNQNSEILEVILEKLPREKINESNKSGDHALLALVKSSIIESNEEKFCKHIELLLNKGIDVNKTDTNNMPTILYAAKKSLKHVIATIFKKIGTHVNIDSHKYPVGNKSARDFILEKHLYNGPLPSFEKMPTSSQKPIDELFALIKQEDEKKFISTFQSLTDKFKYIDIDDGTYTLLQYSCKKGISEIAKFLIENNVNVNKNTKCTKELPIELASTNNRPEILNSLLKEKTIELPAGILPILFRCQLFNKFKYEQCIELLLDKLKTDDSYRSFINNKDRFNQTALHYVVNYGDLAMIQILLDLGASLACKNSLGRFDVLDMDSEILQSHLNQCINSKTKDHKRKLVFDFSSLLPPERNIETRDKSSCSNLMLKPLLDDSERGIERKTEFQAQTELIVFMSRAKEIKHLLGHPLIVSFLLTKWGEICGFYYTNLFLCITFVVFLFAFIFMHHLHPEKSDSSFSGVLFQVVLFVCLVALMIREILQIIVSPRNYFKSFESYIKIALILFTILILFLPSSYVATRDVLASSAIILAALELFLTIGHHPKLSTTAVMFETISRNVFQLVMWYSLLIVAFALSFSILLKKSEINSDGKTDDGDVDPFSGTGQSIFKTIIMSTGEFDYGSINFKTYPICGRLIFSIFVFMSTIILLNLVNELAISDTNSMTDNAELIVQVSRAERVHYFENIMTFRPNRFEFIQKIKSWVEKVYVCHGSRELFVDPHSGEIELNELEESEQDESKNETSVSEPVESTGKPVEGKSQNGSCVGRVRTLFLSIDAMVRLRLRLKLDEDTLKKTNAIIRERNRYKIKKSDILVAVPASGITVTCKNCKYLICNNAGMNHDASERGSRTIEGDTRP